jgi:hypothetical protein
MINPLKDPGGNKLDSGWHFIHLPGVTSTGDFGKELLQWY